MPICAETRLRDELDRFVAAYGAKPILEMLADIATGIGRELEETGVTKVKDFESTAGEWNDLARDLTELHDRTYV